jgi:putative transposase
MKNPTPYLKMRVLGAIETAPGASRRARIEHVSQLPFTDEDGNVRYFTWRTIQTWWSRYQKDGITVMHNKRRSDEGTFRKVTPETVTEAVQQVLPSLHSKNFTVASVYRLCIERGLLRRELVAPNTFRRMVREFEMLKVESEHKRRVAFAKEHANAMWQGDTMVGPYIDTESGKVQAKLIAFIDDASRVVAHGEFFLSDNVDSLIIAFRTALYKRGVPEMLYLDNGANYCSAEIQLVCARLGCLLSHTPVRDGAAKGKIERFFRTVREKFLGKALDLSSLAALNRQFISWLEEEYNSIPHGSLGMKPIDRFGLDLNRIRFMPPSELNDEFFFMEDDRWVKIDNTFSLKNIRFESPVDLREKQIQVRFERGRMSRVIVYYKKERMGEARPVDLIANDRPPRREKNQGTPDSGERS